MRSLAPKPSNRRAVFLSFATSVESQLRAAYAKRFEQGLETQTTLAKKLGVDKSSVNRRLKGETNMTLQTVADMVWGLEQCIEIKIIDPKENKSNSPRIVPCFEAEPVIEAVATSNRSTSSGPASAVFNVEKMSVAPKYPLESDAR